MKLRVALVGTGFIGMQHADAILRQPCAQIVAASDSSAESLKRSSELLGVSGYNDFQEMLEKERIDILHNCTPNRMHYDVARAALEKGIHLYSEKPLANTLPEAEKLVEAAHCAKGATAVNFNYRANAMVWEMRERLKSGDAGRCFVIHGTYLQDWLSRQSDYDWRIEEAGDGPRALADIGSHWFDLAQFVYGKKIVAVCAKTFSAFSQRLKPSGDGLPPSLVPVDNDDGACVIMRFSDGLAASLVISQVSGGYKNSVSISADCENYSIRWNQQRCDQLVIGRRDGGEETIFADPKHLTGEARIRAALPAGHPVSWADALKNSIGAFYADVRDGTWRMPDRAYPAFEEALHAMKIADAALRSSRDGLWKDV
ncbi:MAG: Gfo/Idh/MocA family oxidoreductase [Clostridiales bacterium]|nr:Gfo/Idh/MocA family oxidoreductase [Clostridiales bacterium]